MNDWVKMAFDSDRLASAMGVDHHCGGEKQRRVKAGSLLAALDRNPVAESSSSGIFVGPDFEVHLADALACWWREGAELCARAGWRFHPLVHNFHGASTGKLQKSLNRIFTGLSIG